MKYLKYLIPAITILFFYSSYSLKSQELALSAGGDHAGEGGSISYSIGQVACQFYITEAGSVFEGMQQPRLSTEMVLLPEQQAVVSSGGYFISGGGTLSYSVGQIACQIHGNSHGFIYEGIQQPYIISIVLENEKRKDIQLNLSAYPNPAINYLNLSVENMENSELRYQLIDINGKTINTKQIESNITRIEMSNLSPAIYFVKVLNDNTDIKTFKIIKQ